MHFWLINWLNVEQYLNWWELKTQLEKQGEIKKPSSAISANKYRKTTEWERLEISSRKLDIPMEHFMQKDRNGMDLTEADDIKKRWQEYTEELYKKDLLHN